MIYDKMIYDMIYNIMVSYNIKVYNIIVSYNIMV